MGGGHGLKLTTPVAIVVGSSIIAVGLYLGLRERSQEPPRAAPSSSGSAEATAPITPPATPSAVPVTWRPEDVRRRVTETLEAHRASVVSACLGDAGTKSVGYRFDYVFDAYGRQRTRGVTEDRTNQAPELTRCVLEHLPAVTLPRLGKSMRAQVRFVLP